MCTRACLCVRSAPPPDPDPDSRRGRWLLWLLRGCVAQHADPSVWPPPPALGSRKTRLTRPGEKALTRLPAFPCRPVSWSDGGPWKGLPCSRVRAALFTSCGRSTRGLGGGAAEPGRPRGHLPDWESDPSAADGRRDTVRVSVSVFTDTRRTRTFLLSVFSASAHLPVIERGDTSWSRRCKNPPRRSGPEELDVEPPANCVNLGGSQLLVCGGKRPVHPPGFPRAFSGT